MKNVIHFTCEISCKVPYEDRFESFPDAGFCNIINEEIERINAKNQKTDGTETKEQ